MAAAEDEVSEAEFLRLPLSRLFPVRTTTPVSPRLPPPEGGASRASLAGDVKPGVAIAIDDANGSFFGARAFASRPRRVVRGGERVFLRTRAARPSRRARTRLLTNATTPTLFRRNRTPRPLARTRRVRVNRTRPTR